MSIRFGFIGDIVGRPGRRMIGQNLQQLREEYSLDYVIANYENASHGYGLTRKNCDELLGYGIDMMTGGNHSFDKKDIFELFKEYPLIRPINYSKRAPGTGEFKTTILGQEVVILNLMGHYTMPMVDNPFPMITQKIEALKEEGFKHIVVDFHAEATSEKTALLHMIGEDVSAIFGTHTHVGTDDLQIKYGCCYVTDVGATGCRDGVIGMDKEVPVHRFMTGLGGHFDVPEKCQAIFQMVVFELDDEGRCASAEKVRIYDESQKVVTKAWVEAG